MTQRNLNIAIALSLVFLGASLRLLPHPANFAPVAAIAIFGGSVLPRKLAPWVPLAVMVASDAIIGFHRLIGVTWGSYALIALASSLWLRKPNLLKGVTLTVSSSVFFFTVTNFAVWLWSGMYSHTWSGLVSCYALALPFFRNTFLSDLFYTGVLFGLYALASHGTKRLTRLSIEHA